MAYASLTDRLVLSVKEIDDNGCWIWGRYTMKNGYGTMRFTKGTKLAHRISYELFKGAVPLGHDVMHSCDNPSCINPAHLSTGTRTDNMQDAKAKGRNCVGEKHGRSKLTEIQVKEIKMLDMPQSLIANKYGVSQCTISVIKTGKNWSFI